MKAEQDVRAELAQVSPANRPLMQEDRQRPEVKAAFGPFGRRVSPVFDVYRCLSGGHGNRRGRQADF
jgi:hypothetical protein